MESRHGQTVFPRFQPLRVPLAVAVVAGVPALVLVSVGPLAQVSGSASVLLWVCSACIGLLMAIPFGALMASYPDLQGGVAAASARVIRSHSRRASILVQWSYWLGWSPALGISAALIVELVHVLFLPNITAFFAWLIAVGVMVCAATINQLGLRTCARVQATLAAVCVLASAVLVIAPLMQHSFDKRRLEPMIGSGEVTRGGLLLMCGSLFLAGWSAYGAEVALSYAPDYRHGSRDFLRSLAIVAALVIVVYSVVPALLIGGFGTNALVDPVSSLLSDRNSFVVKCTACIALPLSVVLTLNMISVSGSRVLSQMARNGDVWHRLGHVNRRAIPRNALYFDVAVNATFLGAGLMLNGGHLVEVPVTLLTAANVAYFISLIMALVACAIWRWSASGGANITWRRSGFALYCIGLALLNAALLGSAAAVWGSRNVALGATALFTSFAFLAMKSPPAEALDGNAANPGIGVPCCRPCLAARHRANQLRPAASSTRFVHAKGRLDG
jgi:amino acid transporter